MPFFGSFAAKNYLFRKKRSRFRRRVENVLHFRSLKNSFQGTTMQTIYYATGNRHKFEAAQTFFAQHCPQITLKRLTIDLPERQTHDQKAISQEKALAAWNEVQAPVITDDAGVYFDAYPNFPGFMTRFVWESLGTEGMLKLLDQNNRVSQRVFITYCNGPDTIHTVVGEVAGHLVQPEEPVPADTGKPFLYLVIPDGFEKPFMSLPPEQQTADSSFRYNGLRAFAQWYNTTRP